MPVGQTVMHAYIARPCPIPRESGVYAWCFRQLRRVESGKWRSFAAGEAVLSAWMDANALVTWLVDPVPWRLEARLIGVLCVPLNLDQNDGHPFHRVLTEVRRRAKARAPERPGVRGTRC